MSSVWKNFEYTDADKAADLASIRAGLATLPDTPARRRARAKRRLVMACSALGRAAVLFVLCFAASTLALRQVPSQAQRTCAASQESAPT